LRAILDHVGWHPDPFAGVEIGCHCPECHEN
jgi:hypothetical protein